jgi:RNA polymerase-binding transcription factor DksA
MTTICSNCNPITRDSNPPTCRVLCLKRDELTALIANLHAGLTVEHVSETMEDRVLSDSREAVALEIWGSKNLAEQVSAAIIRVQDGSYYGSCTECGEPIPSKRLAALPWASLCLGCAAEWEWEWEKSCSI